MILIPYLFLPSDHVEVTVEERLFRNCVVFVLYSSGFFGAGIIFTRLQLILKIVQNPKVWLRTAYFLKFVGKPLVKLSKIFDIVVKSFKNVLVNLAHLAISHGQIRRVIEVRKSLNLATQVA